MIDSRDAFNQGVGIGVGIADRLLSVIGMFVVGGVVGILLLCLRGGLAQVSTILPIPVLGVAIVGLAVHGLYAWRWGDFKFLLPTIALLPILALIGLMSGLTDGGPVPDPPHPQLPGEMDFLQLLLPVVAWAIAVMCIGLGAVGAYLHRDRQRVGG